VTTEQRVAAVTEQPAARHGVRDVGFRGDVDGLRAIAIVIVVGFHAGLGGFGGGFVGVDVFFVISGFLITRILLNEAKSTSRVALRSFWAKRIRRLIPAMTLMVIVVLPLSWLLLPRLDWQDIAQQGAASSLYVSNILFARDANNYFGFAIENSPFLHTWSLGVEEQFYLVWPFLFVLAGTVARSRGVDVRRFLIGLFVVVGCGSFALCLYLTAGGSSWAFFGLPARAWEFAVAGLLAARPLSNVVLGRVTRVSMAVVGLGLVALATVLLTSSTPYPGAWALLPVVGTVLVIASGGDPDTGATPVTRLLGARPLQWLGRVSYSWYLWHWPFMILAVALVDDDSVGVRVMAAAVALAVAAVTHRLVENPLRFNPALIASKARTYAFGAGATVLSLVVASIVLVAASSGESPLEQQLREEARASSNQCKDATASDGVGELCVTGDPTGARTVMLVGDSKAYQWTTALAEAALRTNTRLLVRFSVGCPINPVGPDSFRVDAVGSARRGSEAADQCLEHRAETVRLIEQTRPDAVLIVESAHYEATGAEWSESLERLVADIESAGARPALILDNPHLSARAAECLRDGGQPSACAPTFDELLERTSTIRAAERAFLQSHPDVPYYDAHAAICGESSCATTTGDGKSVFADRSHVTGAFASTQVDKLERLLQQSTR
jgi:peptidoglycan/LPS O-acetylase OafA/YrhL